MNVKKLPADASKIGTLRFAGNHNDLGLWFRTDDRGRLTVWMRHYPNPGYARTDGIKAHHSLESVRNALMHGHACWLERDEMYVDLVLTRRALAVH